MEVMSRTVLLFAALMLSVAAYMLIRICSGGEDEDYDT